MGMVQIVSVLFLHLVLVVLYKDRIEFVIQFDQNHDMGGPAGCLQYYTGDMGTVNSFNWQGFAAGSNSVHLANHDYDVCIRKRIDACRICWSPVAPMPGAAGRR